MTDNGQGAIPGLSKDGTIAVLSLGEGENRLNGDSVRLINACLDEVEAGEFEGLVTVATGKVWCNGLDQQWMAAHPDLAIPAVREVERLFARLLAFPMPTVAAVQGHAFAAGMMLALSHDVRIMRSDRGFICLPEVDLGVRFPPGMHALLTGALTPQTARRAMTLGERFTATSALAAGVVNEVAELDSLTGRALEMARGFAGRKRENMLAVKRDLHAPALALLGAADPPAELIEGLTRSSN